MEEIGNELDRTHRQTAVAFAAFGGLMAHDEEEFEDVVTREDLEDVLNFHRSFEDETTQTERFYGTLNYALDKFLSIIVKKMEEEDE